MIRFPTSLRELAADYDVLLCDIWGVVHDGEAAFGPACEALAAWRATRGPVILISNSPRPCGDVAAQLDELDVPRAAWSAIVTSGDATRVLLRQRAPGPALAIGPERDQPLYEGLGLRFGDIEAATFIVCTGLIDDEREGPEDYRAVLTSASRRGLEMVCANPDIVVQRGGRLIYCAGALAELYATLGGAVAVAGKPHAAIYDLCMAAAAELLGRAVDRARVLAIGDGLATDIVGANAQGLDAMFVGGGIHGSAAVTTDGRLDEAATSAMLATAGAHARYAMAALA